MKILELSSEEIIDFELTSNTRNYYRDKGEKFVVLNTVAWQYSPKKDFLYILNVPEDEYTILEGVGGEIWEMLIAGKNFLKICEYISRKYSESISVVENDVSCFLDDLVEKAIIIIKNGGQQNEKTEV